MAETSPPVFGRRVPPRQSGNAPAPRSPALSVAPPVSVSLIEDELASRRHVPRSRRAALVAGLVLGCLYMGAALRTGVSQPPPLAGLDVPRFDPRIALSSIALGGLLAGLRGAMGSLFLLRVGLNALGTTDLVAYAVAGGALAIADTAAMDALGVGLPDHGLAFAAIAGAATAALFRVLAGVDKLD